MLLDHLEEVLWLSFYIILYLQLVQVKHHALEHVNRRILHFITSVLLRHLVHTRQILDHTRVPCLLQRCYPLRLKILHSVALHWNERV